MEVVIGAPSGVVPVHRAGDELAQVVDSRDLHITLVAEVVSLAGLQREHRLLVVQVDQILDVVRPRPVGLLAEERAAEDAAPHVVVVGPGALGLFGLLAVEPRRKVRRQVVSLLRLELLQQRGRPGDPGAAGDDRAAGGVVLAVVGLIAEEAENDLAELVAHRAIVRLMRDVQERVGRLGVQVVDQRVGCILGARAVGAIVVARRRAEIDVAQKLHLRSYRGLVLQLPIRRNRDRDDRSIVLHRPDRQRVRRHRHLEHLSGDHARRDVGGHHLHPKLRVTVLDISAGEAAGIVRLILDPEAHVPLGRLRGDELHLVHVSRREVRRFARRFLSRREVEDKHPIGRHAVQIGRDALLERDLVRAVPSCKRRDRPILVRRRLEVGRNLAHRGHRNLLPGALRRRLRLQCRCQEWEEKKGGCDFHGASPRADSGRRRVYAPVSARSNEATCGKCVGPGNDFREGLSQIRSCVTAITVLRDGLAVHWICIYRYKNICIYPAGRAAEHSFHRRA